MPDVRVHQRELLPRGRSTRSTSTTTTSGRSATGRTTSSSASAGGGPTRSRNASTRAMRGRVRELGDRLPRARLSRGRRHEPRVVHQTVYFGDTISMGRLTLDLGLRYDRQWGTALAAHDERRTPAFPTPRARHRLHRLRRAVPLEQPHAARRHHLRAGRESQVDPPSELQQERRTAHVGHHDTSATPTRARRRVGSNIRGLDVERRSPGADQRNPGRTSRCSRRAAVSTRRTRPRSRRPTRSILTSRRRRASGFIVGFDRELLPNLALQVNYTLRPRRPTTRCSRSSA